MMSGGNGQGVHDRPDQERISRLLLAAYPDRVCKRREEGGGRFVLIQGRGVRVSQDSRLVGSPYIIAVTVDAGEKSEGYVHIASPVTEEVIRSECGRLIETVRKVAWNDKEGRIEAANEERIGAVVLSRRSFTPEDDETAPILCHIIRTVPGILSFSREAKQLQARVRLTGNAFPEEDWPDLAEEQLLSRPEEWLLPWLGGIRSAPGLRAVPVLSALKAKLSRQQQLLLDKRAPAAICVPSGSRARLDYFSGDQPVLAVKLQEMFGLADTPTIAEGRIKILLHLLSPAGRPVQITGDLKGFWNTGYPLVKKELKGRYPKHPWPDDPWSAAPTRRTKS
jgi:ATP-dependent helicase HrpB